MVAATVLWGPAALGHWQQAFTSSAFSGPIYLDDADDAVAFEFCVPWTGTIDKIGCYCLSIDGNPPAYNAGLVTLDATGDPTTTNYGGSTATTIDFTATGWVWMDLAVAATATAGDRAAVRVWPTGTAPDGANRVGVGANIPIFSEAMKRGAYASSWTLNGGFPLLAVHYTTGQVYGLPAVALLGAGYDAADTPDEVGGLFTAPFTCVVSGMQIGFGDVDADASWKVHLYAADNTSKALVTVTDEDIWLRIADSNSANLTVYCAPVTLTAGQQYRLTVEGTHATATITLAGLDFESVASKAAYPEGASWQKTSRANGGAWTEDESAVPHMALILSDITVSSGGGGGARWL